MGRTSKEAGTFFGDALHTVRATSGGYVELLVDLRAKVTKDQVVAVQRNAFGEVMQTYKTEVGGEVAILQRDAMTEPGTRLIEVLYDSPDPKCEPDGCPIATDDYLE
jgi:predicted deacylase